jgi:glutamate formiminotransferase/glutamate formiminotransferase/formiminotetrahydrofolate cyclodeaminase
VGKATTLLGVPNVSEGRDSASVAALAAAFAGEGGEGGVRLLGTHSDADHDRSVFTLAGPPGALSEALMRGAAVAVAEVDVVSAPASGAPAPGQHPRVGALDVAPIVYLRERDRGAACAEALVLADRIGDELEVPVFLYGELTAAAGGAPRTRAELRRGGIDALAARMRDPSVPLTPDFGPSRPHPTAGATLVAARPPLVAFNLRLAPPAAIDDARAIAAAIREGGEAGLPGLRAIAIQLAGGIAQVSMNVERPFELPLAEIVEAVRMHAPVAAAEIVGLAPRAALEGFPQDVPLAGFDRDRHVLENAIGS